MGKVAPPVPSKVRTGKKVKHTAYLVAIRGNCQPPRVYAVVAPSPAIALAMVESLATDCPMIEVVGALSRDLTRRLDLRAGEMRLV